jgi:putative tricarboxylic transport membrane protein
MRIGPSSLSAVVIAIFAALFLLGTPNYIPVITAYENEASPRLFPYMIGTLLLCLSLLLALRELKNRTRINVTKVEFTKVATSFVMVCVGVFLIPVIGFIVSTTLIVVLLTYLLGNKSILSLICLSAGWFAFTYIFFKLFQITFPQGVLI